MAEGTYEFECNRAELLGTAPPSYEDWQEAEKVRREKEQAEEMTVSIAEQSVVSITSTPVHN